MLKKASNGHLRWHAAPGKATAPKAGAKSDKAGPQAQGDQHPRHAEHLKALRDAGQHQGKLDAALRKVADDKTIKPHHAERLAKDYGVIRKGKGRKGALESISKHRAWENYNADADKMAARATPW